MATVSTDADYRKAFAEAKVDLDKFKAEREARWRKEQYEKEWETLSPSSSSIVPLNSGHLECQNSDCGIGTYWCKHIEQYVKDGRDAQSIWDEARPNQGDTLSLTGVKIQVPYVPTLGQWALVEFGDQTHGNYKMYLHWGDGKADIRTGEIPGVDFLGFFSSGEGRRVLRDMIHAWFLPRISENSVCMATAHSFQAQMDWNRDVIESSPNRKEYLAQCWSVLTKNMCLRCAAADIVSTGKDDLVPDVSASRRGGWR